MKSRPSILLLGCIALFTLGPRVVGAAEPGTPGGGWKKFEGNPVLGGDLGTCFDVSLLKEAGVFRMWFSWRPKASIALSESVDGIHWGEPRVVLGPNTASSWESDINRPCVVHEKDEYRMWYTGQADGRSRIGLATSPDGAHWTRQSADPVLSPELPWEGVALMCPHVLWDKAADQWRMWYSGGEQGEPNAIGYATSADGLHWRKDPNNPIFRPEPANAWERDRVTACQVLQWDGWHWMFYIGFADVSFAQIGLARSRDGIGGWERLPTNPILRARGPDANVWDWDAVYKPYAILDGDHWMLWFNGRRGGVEQIGLALHEGRELWDGK